ncbi:MAG: hypothetical protein Kow0069_26800 [Promethearchaeota archaeon]
MAHCGRFPRKTDRTESAGRRVRFRARPADEDLDGDGTASGDYGWDVNGDDRVTKADEWYNLWGCRETRRGDHVSDLPHAMILGNACRLPGATVKSRPASPSQTSSQFHSGTRGLAWSKDVVAAANQASVMGAGLVVDARSGSVGHFPRLDGPALGTTS